MEVINLDPDVKAQLTKLVSVSLCSPVLGQIMMDLVVNHPQPDEPSYATFMKVRRAGGGGGKRTKAHARTSFGSTPSAAA